MLHFDGTSDRQEYVRYNNTMIILHFDGTSDRQEYLFYISDGR